MTKIWPLIEDKSLLGLFQTIKENFKADTLAYFAKASGEKNVEYKLECWSLTRLLTQSSI